MSTTRRVFLSLAATPSLALGAVGRLFGHHPEAETTITLEAVPSARLRQVDPSTGAILKISPLPAHIDPDEFQRQRERDAVRLASEELERQQAFEEKCRAEQAEGERAWEAMVKDDPSLADIPAWFAAAHYPGDRLRDAAQVRAGWEAWKAEHAKMMEAKGRISTRREGNIKALTRIRTCTYD